MSELKAIEELQKRLRAAEAGWKYWKNAAEHELPSLRKENRELYKKLDASEKKNRDHIMHLERKIASLQARLVSRGLLDP